MQQTLSECAFCKSKKSTVKYTTYSILDNHYTINQCYQCHAYFLLPRPNKDILEKAYNTAYYGEKEEKFEGIFEKVIEYFRCRRAKLISRYIPDESQILDIGCGNGNFLSAINKSGKHSLYGNELEGNSANRCVLRHPEIKLKIGTLSKNDFPTESFDLITLFHVFEHLTEPKNILEIICEIIKPNGILVMSFPNISSWQSKIFKGKWLHLDSPRHFFFFEPNDFIKLINKYDFQILRSYYISIEQNPYGMVQSILNFFCKKRDVLFERLKGNNAYAPEYNRFAIVFQKLFFFISFPFFILTDIVSSFFRKSATVMFVMKKNNSMANKSKVNSNKKNS